MTDRLSNFEIVTLRRLSKFGASMRPIRLHQKFRSPIRKLWRKGIVEIWWRTPPSNLPNTPGPFYALTIFGAQLADKFNPAPRGFSGAE